jgi:2-haloacid dehalogenase
MKKPPVIVFDLVGTCLDLAALDERFRAAFRSSAVRREWFSEVLNLVFLSVAFDERGSFSRMAEAALKIVEARHRQKLSRAERKQILVAMRELPAFRDVRGALQRLQAGGFHLAVLTNSDAKAAKQAVTSAGLSDCFEHVLSAADAKRLKPAAEPYRMAAKKCGVKTRQVLFVAAHSWDVRGAKEAGCKTCFVARPGQVLDEFTPKPDVIVADFQELAEALVAG